MLKEGEFASIYANQGVGIYVADGADPFVKECRFVQFTQAAKGKSDVRVIIVRSRGYH